MIPPCVRQRQKDWVANVRQDEPTRVATRGETANRTTDDHSSNPTISSAAGSGVGSRRKRTALRRDGAKRSEGRQSLGDGNGRWGQQDRSPNLLGLTPCSL